MSRKIIIDCDPGIDDAVALCMALFDPRLDVLAITATAGTIEAAQATTNVNAILGLLDPPRYPRVGKATPAEDAPVLDDHHLNGTDGLGECNVETSERQHSLPSEKVIAELLRQHPNEITLVCLGPLSNLSRLIQRDPGAIELIDKVVISGGSFGRTGNATPVAEFNMFFDPLAAEEVFASPTTKGLVPLDVTGTVKFGVELLEKLPAKYTRAGGLLHQLIPFAFRTAHQKLGRELIPLYDCTVIASLVEPELFSWTEMAGKVETQGTLTRGATVFDRRMLREWPINMEVATKVDSAAVQDLIVRSLRYAGQQG